jgi:hypothetical protein
MHNEIGQLRKEMNETNEATKEAIGQLRKEISILSNKINTLTAHALPTLQDGYHNIPVIDAGTVDSCSLEGKHSTWTWFNYGSLPVEKDLIVVRVRTIPHLGGNNYDSIRPVIKPCLGAMLPL